MEDKPAKKKQRGERRTGEVAKEADSATKNRVSRPVPFFRFFLFYIALVTVAAGLSYLIPGAPDAWVTPSVGAAPTREGTFLGLPAGSGPLDEGLYGRTVSTFLITLGALCISLPVAWVYTFTRRLRYDPSLVQSVIILPLVVAGIVAVVQHSVALAFSLAGIVAAVRFRNTLKDPKDAVYIFLALGIGIATGVRAADIALIVSLMFNLVVLVLWKYNLGAVYSAESSMDLLSIGDSDLMLARTSGQRDAIRWRINREVKDMETDGILLVHSDDPEAARRAIELSLAETTKEYRILDNFRRRNGVSTFAVLMRMDEKKGDPLGLLGELDERWAGQISAAEYVPFKHEAEKEKEKEKSS
jgi:TusA-related sulfurtransferase